VSVAVTDHAYTKPVGLHMTTEGGENDASARPPHLTSASCDLEPWPPTRKIWSFHRPVVPWTTCHHRRRRVRGRRRGRHHRHHHPSSIIII